MAASGCWAMGARPKRVLLVDGNAASAAQAKAVIEGFGLQVELAGNGLEACKALRASTAACVVLDLPCPGRDAGDGLTGPELVQTLRAANLGVPVVVVAVQASLVAAVQVMRAGAFDYIVRPYGAARLLQTIEAAIGASQAEGAGAWCGEEQAPAPVPAAAAPSLAPEAAPASGFEGFTGRCPAMLDVYRILDAAARSMASVFVTGESGTGKELVAEALHRRSNRSARPMVAINCGAIPRDLLESTLFGHVKGAFTNASSDVEGAAARADGSTLFLDEIGEMDPTLQVKLLRFIQTGAYQRVGDPRPRQADIRFIAATNRDPAEAIAAGTLRQDLFYRLNVVGVHLPPLRERGGDVLLIARRLLAACAAAEGKTFHAASAAAEDHMRRFPWPGNVRQLQNAIHSAVVLNEGPVLTAEMLAPIRGAFRPAALEAADAALPPGHAGAEPPHWPEPGADHEDSGQVEPLCRAERKYIEWAIGRCNGNLQATARKLGISPSTIYRKKETWDRQDIGSFQGAA